MTTIAAKATSASATPGASAPARNPWPCTRCGTPVEITKHAGKLPLLGLLFVLLACTLSLSALLRRHAGVGVAPFALAVALLLLSCLTFLRRARAALRCPRCKHTMRARLRHAGPSTAAVLVPTYNNEASIADVLRRIGLAAPELDILVVDDGSTDATSERARAAIRDHGLRAEVLAHRHNRGKGAALLTGIRAAFARGYSHVISLDADGQHFPEDLPEVRAALERDPTAILVGARDLSLENVESISRFGRDFSNFWLRVQTGRRLADSQSGFRVYPTAPVLALGNRARAYDFEVEVLTVAARAGIPLSSIPIRVYYPAKEERVSHFDKLWDNARISWVNTRLLAAAPLWPLGWPARMDKRPPPPAFIREWSGKSRGGALGHLFFFTVLKLFGPRPAYLLLYPVAFYFRWFGGAAIRHSAAFLDRAIGPEKNPWRRFWRSYRHVHTFARCILDRAIVQVAGKERFSSTAEGYEHVSQKRGAILLSAHLGNYEIAGAFLRTEGVAMNVVMMDTEAEAIKRVHARFGRTGLPNIIAVNKSEFPALKILSALRSGEAVALHGDRVIDEHYAMCDFFGDKAAFPTGVFLIAAAAKVPVVLTFGFLRGPGDYRFLAEPPRMIELSREGRAEALAAHAQWYASRIEAYARAYPYQWFNFYDFWKTPGS